MDGAGRGRSLLLARSSAEILLVGHNDGKLWRLIAAGSELDPNVPQTLDATGLFSNTSPLTPAPGVIPYDVNVPGFASLGQAQRWLALPGDSKIGFTPTSEWDLPVGTALVEQFDLPTTSGTKHVETRVLLRQTSGWRGYTYWWIPDQSRADLITSSLTYTYEIVDLGNGPLVLGGTPDARGVCRCRGWGVDVSAGCARCGSFGSDAASRV
jgi:hypothetical protein